MTEQQRVKLASGGMSPYLYHALLSGNGVLSIDWTWGGVQRVQAFTPEETYNLLKFLEQHRDEIEAGNAQWQAELKQSEQNHPF